MSRRPCRTAQLFLACLLPLLTGLAVRANERKSPRLVVLISIDQFRPDYLDRFADLFVKEGGRGRRGGFAYLRSQGTTYADCQYEHYRTVTAAGHAVLGTGAQPAVSGVVGNSWWDRETRKSIYCVADPQARVVGAVQGSRETPMSAANLLVTTVGDELELATGGHARTVSLGLKDRAAILLTAHRADVALWFDEDTGRWISSSAYAPTGSLPSWVDNLNKRAIPASQKQGAWTPSVPPKALARVWKRPAAATTAGFSHALTGTGFGAWGTSPLGNDFVLKSALEAVRREGMGSDDVPDLLTINLASNDYVGHRYGPDSAECLDLTVQTDRQLAEFFNGLERVVPDGLSRVVIALSSDHGVAGVPETHAALGVPVARMLAARIRTTAESALDSAVGPADWIAATDNGDLYFHPDALKQHLSVSRTRLETLVADAVAALPGVHSCYGRSAILAGRVPATAIGRRLAPGFHPRRSGDVVVILVPGWLAGSAATSTGTSHGSPFTYDAHVPLLVAGPGVGQGKTVTARTSPAQVAPALSFLLGIARPSGADEPMLPGLD